MIKNSFFLLGITLGVGGIVAAFITASWSTAPIALLVAGIVCLMLSLWLWGNQHKFWQQRSTKRGAGAFASTAIALLAFVLINLLAISNNTRWDLSENKLFTLSQQSQAIVRQLEQPLEVLIFDRNLNPQLEALLQNYRRQNQQFSYRLVDPEQQIGLAQQFGVQSLGEVYLRYGEKRQKLVRSGASAEIVSEIQITNGIEKIKRDRQINIYLLQGHGESPLGFVEGGLAQAIKSLEDRGNKLQPLNLADSGNIPEDANLIVVAGATRQLLAAEVTLLQKYLENGGNLLLSLVPNLNIGIEPLLTAWGIELDDRFIVDGSGASTAMGFGPAVVLVNDYGEHPISANFSDGMTIFPESRPLKVKSLPEVESVSVAITNQQTWAESDLSSEEISFDDGQDLPGGLNVAIALSRQQPQASRLVVFGSTTFITNGWFQQQLNSDLLLNAVSWLVGEDDTNLAIRPKEAANRRINLSGWQSSLVAWLAIRIMPLIALIAGVLVWRKRK